jgi:hypothetical protein
MFSSTIYTRAAAALAAVGAFKSQVDSYDGGGRRAKRVLPHCSYITGDAVRLAMMVAKVTAASGRPF